MTENAIKNTEFVDAPAPILEDLAPELLIKVYPYIMINADKERMFIQNNSVSITTISQYPLITNGEFHNLVIDDNGALYFDLLAATVVEGKMDIASSTSVFGNTFQFEHRFTGITDQFFDHKYDFPVVFTFGEPFSEDKFEKGELEVYTSNTITPAGNFNLATIKENTGSEINEATLTEIDFVNIKVVEAQFTNARVIFTRKENLSKNVSSFDGNKGISLGIQAHSLVHSIKGKGITQELDSTGKVIGEVFGEIDLISKEKWAPFKFTPGSIKEKLTMYADWFDYDNVLPFVLIEKFKAGGELKDIIANADDLKMIEDLLALSAGYASSWDTAPVITSGSETGKIKPDFRVGYRGIKVSLISNKNPIDMVDTIFENHIREFPEFETEITRYQPAKAVINALSRYIYSTYAIGKGHNSFNQAYLPWYLEPYFNTPIKFDKKISIQNPDKGAAIGNNVDTFVINDGVKFQAKSIYFHRNFSSDIAYKGRPELELPVKVNFSNQKLVQTDRKLTLPEMPETVSPINKMPLPGDINTKSSDALEYIFYLPLQGQTIFEEFMLNKLTAHTGPAVGTDIDVQLPPTPGGTTWDQLQANNAILAKYPGGIIKTATILSQEKRQYVDHAYSWEANRNGYRIFKDGKMISEYEKRRTQEEIIAADIGVPVSGLVLTVATNHKTPTGAEGTYKVELKFTRFSLATVSIISQAGTTFSYTERQILFDKQEWKDFLSKFNFVPNSFIPYTFDERPNWKISKIDELIITSVWGDELEIFFGPNITDYIRIPLFNKDDESIATQRILFN